MQKLTDALTSLNIRWDDSMAEKLVGYMDGVLLWNEKINLTAIKDRDDFVEKHLIDSILCCGFEEYINAESVIDVGTGAGFPGVPLAVISPDKEFVLADSLNKRLKVISNLTEELDIGNVETVHGRAEELARNKKYRETFDVCVSRAVANMAVLAEYCLPFIKKGGYLLAYKGPDAEKEMKEAEKAVKILGGKLRRIQSADLEGYEHNIVVIEKIKETPAKYPRKAGLPGKEPLK